MAARLLVSAGVCTLGLAAWSAAGAAAPAHEWPRTQTYGDPTGDSGPAADVAAGDLALDEADALTSTVTEPNRAALAVPGSLTILVYRADDAANEPPGVPEYESLVQRDAV